MFSRKAIISIIFIGVISLSFPVFADDISDMKGLINDTITKLIQKYETQIQALQEENAALKQEILALKGTGTTTVISSGNTVPSPALVPKNNNASTGITITSAMTKSDIYSAIVVKISGDLGSILRENNLPAYSAIGLFEFIEPNAVFISLDDGKNPE
jgi:hypothetical protein